MHDKLFYNKDMSDQNEKRLYLAGSIHIWNEYFLPNYSKHFNNDVCLFEPGALNISPDHREISSDISKLCVDEIKSSDAILMYMKPYTPEKNEGTPGVDSSWECGFAYGLGKPVIALIDDVEHARYFEDQWMISHNITAFITTNNDAFEFIKKSDHYKNPTVLFTSNKNNLEQVVMQYLDETI